MLHLTQRQTIPSGAPDATVVASEEVVAAVVDGVSANGSVDVLLVSGLSAGLETAGVEEALKEKVPNPPKPLPVVEEVEGAVAVAAVDEEKEEASLFFSSAGASCFFPQAIVLLFIAPQELPVGVAEVVAVVVVDAVTSAKGFADADVEEEVGTTGTKGFADFSCFGAVSMTKGEGAAGASDFFSSTTIAVATTGGTAAPPPCSGPLSLSVLADNLNSVFVAQGQHSE